MSGPTEYKVTWSDEDQEWVATTPSFPSLSFLHTDAVTALFGLIFEVMEKEDRDDLG